MLCCTAKLDALHDSPPSVVPGSLNERNLLVGVCSYSHGFMSPRTSASLCHCQCCWSPSLPSPLPCPRSCISSTLDPIPRCCSRESMPARGVLGWLMPATPLNLGRPRLIQLRFSPSHPFSTTEDIAGRTCICSYAKLAALAAQDMSALDEMWDPQDECSQAILSGGR